MKNGLQRFGKFLSAMIMPNIGAFIAWGFITTLFIPDGWLPNEGLASIQPYMLTYLLPILIAYTGGKMIAKERGGVIGAITVAGTIAGVGGTNGQPMLMAAMVVGPLAGLCIKKFDEMVDGHIPAGFEMLVNNFSIGIFGMLLAILGYYLIGPFMQGVLAVLSAGVDVLVNHGLLPLSAIFIEPAKVLFLNNAINHGIFTPIGIEQAAETGKSIMYMLEANPGPGLGVLLAYMFFSNDKTTKQSAPGAIIIHFLGGIHEIYFPYILMNPVIIIAPIVGNICAIAFYSMFNVGLRSPASPGSIIAFMSMAPKGQGLLVFLGVALACAVSFVIGSAIVKATNGKGKSLSEATDEMKSLKGTKTPIANVAEAKLIVFACDAGMGSSAMGATKFRNRLKAARPDIKVINTSVDTIPSDADIAVVQSVLVDRAKACAPNATIVEIGNFLADAALDNLYFQLTTGDAPVITDTNPDEVGEILSMNGIYLDQHAATKEEAITLAGKYLVANGYVLDSYIPLMLEREKVVSTYMGMGLAIPHGTTHDESIIKKTGIVFLQFKDGVDFGDEKAQIVIGIAGKGGEHMNVLARVASALDNAEVLAKLKSTDDKNYIYEVLTK